MTNPLATACWGIFCRRERWSLSWRGWFIAFGVMILAAALFAFSVVPFLAINHRVEAPVLVVEGWVHEYSIRQSIEEFKSGAYRRIFTTGGPVLGYGGYTNDFNTTASVAAERLVAAGMPANLVQMVPSRVANLDRTYNAAVALREWAHRNNVQLNRINIVTEDIHARRTRLLFQQAFGNEVAVGIIAVPNPDYDMRRWWRYSEGIQEVFRECLAYLYAKFFFHPSAPASTGPTTASG